MTKVIDVLAGVPESLWTAAAAAPRRLLALDYDGTIAPFRVDRREAAPLPRTLDAVRRLAASSGTSVAIVSGRPVEDLRSLLPDLWAHLVGAHGWEERAPGGGLTVHALPAAAAAALDRAEREARAAGLGDLLERKRGALVLHTRGMNEAATRAREEAAVSAWRAAQREGLRLARIHGGLEIRAPGRDKGSALRDLLAREPRGVFPVYVGDDSTDEDAFEALLGIGCGVRVGPPSSGTRAGATLPSIESVPHFLERWLDLVERSADSAAGGAP